MRVDATQQVLLVLSVVVTFLYPTLLIGCRLFCLDLTFFLLALLFVRGQVLEAIATFPNICRQLHLPAQSGSTAVLVRAQYVHFCPAIALMGAGGVEQVTNLFVLNIKQYEKYLLHRQRVEQSARMALSYA